MLSYDARVYNGHEYNNNQHGYCCRHYLKFNGDECTNPGTIEGVNSMNRDIDLHRPSISMLLQFRPSILLLLLLYLYLLMYIAADLTLFSAPPSPVPLLFPSFHLHSSAEYYGNNHLQWSILYTQHKTCMQFGKHSKTIRSCGSQFKL